MSGSKISTSELFSKLAVAPAPKLPAFLKWKDTIVGKSNPDLSLDLLETVESIPAVKLNFIQGTHLSTEEFRSWLTDRVPSSDRRDIEKILRRAGLSSYNVFRLASSTRAISARDLLWLSEREDEKFDDVFPDILKTIFNRKQDLDGGSNPFSPEGVNEKRYAVSSGYYGIIKERLNPSSSDSESEIAVYELSKLLGVNVCPAWLVGGKKGKACFSQFVYKFEQEYIVHLRRLFGDNEWTNNLYQDLIGKLPNFEVEIQQMILLDFVTRQTDRHMSNAALKVSGEEVTFYPLYDNGRSLFFEDTDQTINDAVTGSLADYSESFGSVGTFYDCVLEIADAKPIGSLINLDISKEQVRSVYQAAGITEPRLSGAVTWTVRCLEFLKSLDKDWEVNK